ncbi:MAG: hypothetical protein CJD30_11600, partial [Sulfuricurvum sp. PD_MW2]|uniref:hypothetical protein n=1 Tax=Sulfuricurvum sp. PD_MW2 TaxID=2027917 RepID=UPI000C062722
VGEKTDDLDFVEKEKERLLDELIFDQLKIKFDSSKIYVDVESLINKRLDTYKQLFELLLTAQSSFDRTEEYILLEEEELLIPVNDISTVTAKIYYHLLNDFVRNTDYGLDKYLSADIRHGFFVTHMRSGVEKFDLLTDLDENGEYEDYSIWLEKFSLINSSIKLAMNDSLKTFAKEYDTALNEANNWFRISWIITNTQDEKSNVEKPIFDFEPTIVRLDNLKKRIIHIENFDSFMNEILSFMWSITENATIEAKNRLNTVLKPRLDNAFTTLTSSIDECKQNIPLKELLDNISAAHYTMQNDLERILNWFNCMTDDQAQQYNVQNTVKSCIGIFKTRNSDLDIVFNPINSSNH